MPEKANAISINGNTASPRGESLLLFGSGNSVLPTLRGPLGACAGAKLLVVEDIAPTPVAPTGVTLDEYRLPDSCIEEVDCHSCCCAETANGSRHTISMPTAKIINLFFILFSLFYQIFLIYQIFLRNELFHLRSAGIKYLTVFDNIQDAVN
jgi:hypothetical protein